MLKLVVGLGNPGPTYLGSPHNLGFEVVDALAREREAGWETRSLGLVACLSLGGAPAQLVKPLTFMNASGRAVQSLLKSGDVRLSEVLVVHDELDLPFGVLKLKRGGGTAGHNGLLSICAECGGANFARLRVGVGRPQAGSIADYLLTPLSAPRQRAIGPTLERAAQAVMSIGELGFERATALVNRRKEPAESRSEASPSDPQGDNSSPPRGRSAVAQPNRED